MITLNLIASNKEQERVKDYLQNNISETLADKINNGVKITKDNKSLLNKKDLNGFMKFACEEARKQVEKGSNSACVEDEVVFGWAIHYFEEDSIEGTLYNKDGTEYKTVIKTTTSPAKTQTVKTPTNKQATLFDMFEKPKTETEQENEQTIKEESENTCENDCAKEYINEVIEEEKTEVVRNQIIDYEQGEVISQNNGTTSPIDKDYAKILYTILDGNLEVE